MRNFLTSVWSRGKFGALSVISGLLFVIGGLYDLGKPFYGGSGFGLPSMTASQFNSVCNGVGADGYGLPACLNAANVVNEAHFELFFGLMLLLTGALWVYQSVTGRADRLRAWLALGSSWCLFWLVEAIGNGSGARVLVFVVSIVITVAGYYVRAHGWPRSYSAPAGEHKDGDAK